MKRITIGNKEYIFEFSIEATLYNECTEGIMDLMIGAGLAQAEAENSSADSKEKVLSVVESFKKTVSDIPQKALTLFYAGLLEHHGAESTDRSILSRSDAKKLLVRYMNEHDGMSLFDVMNEMMEEMGKDHFFERIGVDKVIKKTNSTLETTQE